LRCELVGVVYAGLEFYALELNLISLCFNGFNALIALLSAKKYGGVSGQAKRALQLQAIQQHR
jgi:hypothetical protein